MQWPHLGAYQSRVVAPVNAGYVHVQLDFVSVRVLEVEAVRHGMVRCADHGRSCSSHSIQCLAKGVVAIANLQAEVVHADPPALWDRFGSATYLDQQELVMRPASGKGCYADNGFTFLWDHLTPPEDVSIEAGRAIRVFHVQHNVP